MQKARETRLKNVYAVLTLAAIALGIASRQFMFLLPPLLHKNAGDMIWGLMVFLGVRALIPRFSVARIALSAVVFAACIEFFKLYDPPWLHAVRATTLGWLVLGHGFHVSNLVCYGLGIAFGALGAALGERKPTPALPRREEEEQSPK